MRVFAVLCGTVTPKPPLAESSAASTRPPTGDASTPFTHTLTKGRGG